MPKGFDPRLNDPSNYDGHLPPDWEDRVDFTIRRDDHTCLNCDTKQEFDALRVVHELPLVAGGTNHFSNLLTLCQACCSEFTDSNRPAESTADNRVLEKQSDVPTMDSTDNADDTDGDLQRVPDIVSEDYFEADSQSRTGGDGVGGPKEQSQPEFEAQRAPKWKGQPTADDSLSRPDAPQGSPADKRRRRRQHQRRQDATDYDPTDYGLFGRSILAFAIGTTMFAVYVLTIALFVVLTSDPWTTLAALILPLGGALLGTRYPLSTIVAVGYLSGLVGIILAVVPLPPEADGAWFLFGEPVVVPLLGVAHGLVADHYEFSLLEEVPRPQILD
jgi:hypothetical protein